MGCESQPHIELPSNIQEVRIKTMPESMYYIANFITADEERDILQKVGFSSDCDAPTIYTRSDTRRTQTTLESPKS